MSSLAQRTFFLVCCWFYEINKDGAEWFPLRTYPKDESSTSFTLVLEAWADRSFEGARVGWFAYYIEEEGKRMKSNKNTVLREAKMTNKHGLWYETPFSKKPATFIAISELCFGTESNLRILASIHGAAENRLQWSYGTWADSNMDHVAITWVGMEQ